MAFSSSQLLQIPTIVPSIYILLITLSVSHGRPHHFNPTSFISTGNHSAWSPYLQNERGEIRDEILTFPRSDPPRIFSRWKRSEEDGRRDDYEDEDTQQLHKFRDNILQELGYDNGESRNIPNSGNIVPKINITMDQYIAAYTQYAQNVRRRKEKQWDNIGHQRRRKNSIIRPYDIYGYATDDGDEVKTFHFNVGDKMTVAESLRLKRAEIILPSACQVLNLNSTSFLVERQSSISEGIVMYDLTEAMISWLFRSNNNNGGDPMPFEVTASCGSEDNEVSNESPIVARLHLVTSQVPRRSRRSAPTSTLKNFKSKHEGRDCSKMRRGKACCRRSLKVKFAELGISDVIIEPHEFDAHVCVGRCNAKRVAYSTTHAMFQHILHQTKGKKFAPRPCCTPTKLTELDVIHLDPSGNKLEVTVLKDAIVEECGCS